jgi:HSP20 family protein
MAETKREVTRRDPFADLDAFSALGPFREFAGLSRLSRMMDEMWGEPGVPAMGRCALDVTESEKEYAISAELPGVKKDDLTVECKDGVLTIRGEKKSQREEKKDRARLLERTYGAFSRSLRLPEDADIDQIRATFQDGVLRLEMPKRADAKPRTIAIKS